ncbi:MAG: Flp family type IVb pilin [Acidimicrobiia bacterium]
MTNPATLLYMRATNAIRAMFDREEGASMVEYALLVALIAMVAFAAVTLVGQALDSRYDSIASSVAEA